MCEAKESKNMLLEVRNLRVYFGQDDQLVKAVDGVSFNIANQEVLALVGESGCGKTVTALSITKLLPREATRVIDGEIIFKRENLFQLDEQKMRMLRGGSIAYVFQEPTASLNPVFTIGAQIVEAIMLHQNKTRAEACALAITLLGEVGIPTPQQRFNYYPHQLSGGMNQRAMIAMALSSQPQLLIADEPTTALDVTIEAQILSRLVKLKQEKGLSILFITHDLKIVPRFADRIVVMYAGKIMEILEVSLLQDRSYPKGHKNHPYTLGLLDCIPKIGKTKGKLRAIKGEIPSPLNLPSGCLFHPRCPEALPLCKKQQPELKELTPTHWVVCHRR